MFLRFLNRKIKRWQILKCNNGSIEWNRAGSSAGLNGFAKINKEYFGRVLDPNQKLRIFDNVPKKAVAQETSFDF